MGSLSHFLSPSHFSVSSWISKLLRTGYHWGKQKHLYIMAMRVVEFSSGGTKLERFLLKNQDTRRKLLNFENWCSGEVSKSAKI